MFPELRSAIQISVPTHASTSSSRPAAVKNWRLKNGAIRCQVDGESVRERMERLDWKYGCENRTSSARSAVMLTGPTTASSSPAASLSMASGTLSKFRHSNFHPARAATACQISTETPVSALDFSFTTNGSEPATPTRMVLFWAGALTAIDKRRG